MKILSPTLKKLVKVLNKGEFHSGTELGKALNTSRNAIWKHINQLTKYGIAIELVQSKGYCLQQSLLLLDKTNIKEHINYRRKLNNIRHIGTLIAADLKPVDYQP